MSFDREAAKRAGYSEEEIEAYLRAQTAAPAAADAGDAPPPPSTVIPEVSSTASNMATAGGALVEYGLPAAGGAAAAYGTYKLGRYGVDRVVDAAAERIAARMPQPVAPVTPAAPVAAPAPVVPQPVAPTTSPILDAQGRPMVRPAPQPVAPVAPTAAAGPLPPTLTAGEPMFRPPAQPSVINRASDIVKQLALSKVAPALGAAARVAGPAGLAYSIYEASPYIQQGGQELASGQAQQRMREAQRAVLNAPTPAPLTAQEAQNLIASGDQRLINIYRNDPQVARLLGAAQAR